jgi:hypothetical protein
LKFPRQCPLVLLVKVVWRGGETFGCEEGGDERLKFKLDQIIFKNSVRTSKRTPHFTIKKIKWLMMFKEIIDVCSEHINTFVN